MGVGGAAEPDHSMVGIVLILFLMLFIVEMLGQCYVALQWLHCLILNTFKQISAL